MDLNTAQLGQIETILISLDFDSSPIVGSNLSFRNINITKIPNIRGKNKVDEQN